KNRQQARKDRKEAEVLKQREQAEQEAREAPDDGAEEERRRLDVICRKQHWQIYEMEPDGHCLFNAIADQLNFWRISSNETYATTRRAAAAFMMEHPDDFLPYLPASEIDPSSPDGVLSPEKYSEYCDSIATTAVWGGQTEINALSRYWKIPIHVIQSDGPEVKVGEEAEGENGKKGKKRAPLRISYHKKMYGLGEHYNSVRP
ncbi:cysteine proteinase, partial [Atractiella rhizophila]